MSSFTLFRRGECPICGGVSKGCRQSNDTGLVFCRDTGANPTGYVYRGEDVWGFGLWQYKASAEAFSKQAKQEREQQRRELRAAQQRRKQQQIAQQLSAVERDRWYRRLLARLTLTEGDRSKLLERGFTSEQIDFDCYKSVSQFHQVGIGYPTNLPGILTSGFGSDQILNVPGDGILCPIYNFDGLIIGCQVRLHDSTDGRYRWLTSATKKNPQGATSHLNGELPLGIFEPLCQNLVNSIWLTEGTTIKPSLVRHRLGVPVLGAASGRFNTSPEISASAVEYLAAKYQTKLLTFAVDAGDVVNRSGVPERWQQQFRFFEELGYTCRIAWWGQVDKTFGDIDELQPERYESIRFLTPAEFKELCVKWGGLETRTKASNLTQLDYQERVAKVQKKLHTLSYPVDLVCDPSKKYLPDLVGQIPVSGIVALKAPKGSGKSYQIKQIKNHCCGYWSERIIQPSVPILASEQLEILGKAVKLQDNQTPLEPQIERIRHKGLGMNFLSINARIALGREQAIRWEFTWIEDADLEAKTEFEGAKFSSATILENIGEIGLCWDSLGKIFGRDWSNTLVVIDEIELGLNHVVTSSTCRDRRSFILHTLEHKLRECLDNGGLVVVADADLTDTTLDYLTTIAPGYPPFIVSHDFKGEPWEVDFYTGKRDVILSQIESWLADPNCRPIAITLDNQKEAEALSIHLTRKFPWLLQQEGGLIRIDSKITQTDFGKDFVKRPNESIQKFQPKVLIYTPSLGVGCSIDIEYFAHVFGLCFGNLEPSQARQMLARVRPAVPRTVWCKARALNTENESTSYLPSEIKHQLFNYYETSTQLVQLAITLAREKAENAQSDAELLPHLIEVLQGMMGENGTWNNPHIDLYCQQVARRNYSLSQLAVQLRQELIDEGHRVNDFGAQEKTAAADAVRQGKEEIKHHDATRTAIAKDITFEEAIEIKRKPARTADEDYAATKAFLKRELPSVELTADFLYKAVYKDNRRWLNQTKLHWWCLNQDAIKYEDEQEWRHKLKQFSKGVPFLPDIKTYGPKVEAIIKSSVLEWINPTDLEAEYCNSSPEGKKFLQKALGIRKLLKTALRITVTKDSHPIALANRILGRLGLGLAYIKKEKNIKYYKLDEELATDPDRAAVWSALKIRWSNEKSQFAETKPQQALEPGTNSNESLYINVSLYQQNQPESLPKTDVISSTTRASENRIAPQIAEMLAACDDCEVLRVLWDSGEISPALFRLALEMLPDSPHKNWILEWLDYLESQTVTRA
ncbi:plasmid replication protein, CyRepA1 family [Fischerella sp. PCC 9605]|uniref:plasmid replication protein, CyRepA1 family n=1 Tax=Fischerella sp. PCC 9605 TaxID=1173024 RepID=UPI00047D8A95|nr:plasmid replication protein, CyRepA1 family [Fischerella sp. PCC 9605]